MLDRYLKNLSIEVEHFALCKLDAGWRLGLPAPPVAMLHFVVQGKGWIISEKGGGKQWEPTGWLSFRPDWRIPWRPGKRWRMN